MTLDGDKIRNAREAFLIKLRNESGYTNLNCCPVCGSVAWDADAFLAYCIDCGFDVNSEFRYSPQVSESPQLESLIDQPESPIESGSADLYRDMKRGK